jgi:uncharacterized protein (DUF433 family)
MELKELITIDDQILAGQPVFKGTRVPIECFFEQLESGVSMEDFLTDFPSVTKEQAIAILEIATKLLTSKNIAQLYEIAA